MNKKIKEANATIKRKRTIALFSLAMLLLLVSTFIYNVATAQITTYTNTATTLPTTATLCSTIIPQSELLTIPTGVLSTTLLIILTMAILSGVIYAVGYSLKINKFVNFSKTEFGEIAVTILLVLILFGSFAALTPNGLVNINPLNTRTTFINDCNLLESSSFNVYNDVFTYFLIQNIELQLVSSFTVELEPGFFGFNFSPFVGYGLESSLLNTMLEFVTMLATLMIALIIVLGVIYAIFPIFLYLGIIFRAVPWTRVAGGSLIALFIGFYMLFPVLLGAMMGAYTPINPSMSYFDKIVSSMDTLASSGVLRGVTIPLATVINIYKNVAGVLGFNLIYTIIQGTVEPVIYTVFALVLSLIISLDFTELMGDFLGAPSLSSKNTLSKVL